MQINSFRNTMPLRAKQNQNKASVANKTNSQNPNFGAYLNLVKCDKLCSIPFDFLNDLNKYILDLNINSPSDVINVFVEMVGGTPVFKLKTAKGTEFASFTNEDVDKNKNNRTTYKMFEDISRKIGEVFYFEDDITVNNNKWKLANDKYVEKHPWA